MTTRLGRSAGLTGYIDLARGLGVDPYRMAASVGLPSACLTDPDLKVSSESIGRLLEVTARRAGAQDIGLRLAEGRRLSNLGAVALVVREQPTLRAAIETLIHYAWLQNEALSLRLEPAGPVTLLRLEVATERGGGRQGTELTIGVLVRTLRDLLGKTWRPEVVAFRHTAPENLATHRRVLGLTPTFGEDFTGLVLPTADLDKPIPAADPDMARQAQRYVDQIAGARHADPAAVVRDLLAALLPTGGCSIERVAAHMGLTRRTLHRRLARQGVTFTELLSDVRRRAAAAHLATPDRSLTEIAGRLGYSSLSAFSRWRRKSAKPGRAGSL